MLKKIIVFSIVVLLLPFTCALQMLEPVMIDVEKGETIDIGVVAPGEYFLISFFLEKKDMYDVITTDAFGSNFVSFENIQTTVESIFSIARINEETNGKQKIKIILKNSKTNESTEIYLNANIKSNVISTFVLPHDKTAKFGEQKEIKIKILNSSITTKKITISSDLPNTWFETKNQKLNKEKSIYLEPAGTTEITYSFFPKTIGDSQFKIYIYTDLEDLEINKIMPNYFKKTIYERNEEIVNIHVLKTLGAVYGANLFNFPTFGLNSIPIYFFNNIIRIITHE